LLGAYSLDAFDSMTRWQLPATADLVWRNWEGESVVHHSLSNDTHRLSVLAGEILNALRRFGALDVEALARRCRAESADVAATLDALARVDLVVKC